MKYLECVQTFVFHKLFNALATRARTRPGARQENDVVVDNDDGDDDDGDGGGVVSPMPTQWRDVVYNVARSVWFSLRVRVYYVWLVWCSLMRIWHLHME